MSGSAKWSDDYWLPLLELYLCKPVGVKRLYNRRLIDLSLELHLPPALLHKQLQRLRLLDNPRIQQLWQRYSNHPRQLSKAVAKWRSMRGFGLADDFYDGVDRLEQDFERLLWPIAGAEAWNELMLVLVLDLYFRLTPLTMVSHTPEVQQLAKRMKVTVDEVVDVLHTFQQCDPYMMQKGERKEEKGEKGGNDSLRSAAAQSIVGACQHLWTHYQHMPTGTLEGDAAQMNDYFE